jgi:hypothetical protein
MALKITDTEITSDEVSAYAEWSPDRAADGSGAWVVVGAGFPLAARCFDRNQAISAMTVQEEKAKAEPDQMVIAGLEGELWLSPEASF